MGYGDEKFKLERKGKERRMHKAGVDNDTLLGHKVVRISPKTQFCSRYLWRGLRLCFEVDPDRSRWGGGGCIGRAGPLYFFAEIGCLTWCGCLRQKECTKSCELT